MANPGRLFVPDHVMIDSEIFGHVADRVAAAIALRNHLVVCGVPQLERTERGHPVYVVTLGHARAGGVTTSAGQVQFMIFTSDP